ncbi:hypothetical protein BSZ39_07690 [Bowdeniella nasicola]|uniref:Solute-binding protein family 5 domain-containing protein n=2 Tax=Bowdeniella nasicola TaxID=208480 RepID=A0A1Q5Q219_9ACTO|nr:hypothetical protein BSZ39_07690 [Bowdeniella nasicola]
MFSARRWKRVVPAVLLAASMTVVGACSTNKSGGNEGSGGEKKDGPALVVFAGSQTPLVNNFNPYSPTLLPGTLGSIYEPLFFYNKAADTEPVPLLAESFKWAEDGKSLDIKIRPGVKWNDGSDLTLDDVIFSFTNSGVQADYLDKAEKVDESTVRLIFNTPAYTNEYSLLGATYIVPKKVFGELDDLVTFANSENPVGTGPFMLDTFTDASYTVKKNPNYWDKERPGINTVQYLGIDGNSSAESLLKSNQLDYTTMFIPDPKSITSNDRIGYLLSSSPNMITIITCSNTELGCKGPQTDKEVRKAFSKAINRAEVNEKAYHGTATLASSTFTKPERDEKWVADGMEKVLPETADAEGAKKILEDAGYALGSDGIYAKDGERVSINMVSVEGWSDANAASDLIVAQAKAAGIEIKNDTVTLDQYTDMRQTGQFQMVYSAIVGTPIADPYTMYRNNFTTSFTTPVGESLKPNQTNFARFSNEELDKAVAAAAQTNEDGPKAEAYAKIQGIIADELPYIPMFHGGSQTFYNQTDFTGWPTESDLYAFPASWDAVSAGYVISKLTYK